MNRQQTLCLLAVLWLAIPMFGQYAHLREKLDNDYINVGSGNILKFTYLERYPIVTGVNNQATCKIFDARHHVVGSPILVTNQYGLNEHTITLPPQTSFCEPYYILEVTGINKGEAGYLRLKVEGSEFLLAAKVFLDGAYESANLKMRNDVVKINMGYDANSGIFTDDNFPLTEPFTGLGFTVNSGGMDEPTTNAVLLNDINGDNGIVDWVMLELRPSSNNATIAATRAALVQRDGDIVEAADGVSPVRFHAPLGQYHVAVRHRSHLGVMTNSALQMVNCGTTTVDFTVPGTATWGTNNDWALGARKNVSGVMTLWTGNSNVDDKIVYQDPDPNVIDDVDEMYNLVVNHPLNNLPQDQLANYIINPAYYSSDVDMNGKVIYQGPNNDRSKMLLTSILMHPMNTGLSSGFVILQQLP